MSFESIIGQPLTVKLVQRWLAKKTTQPLLFFGPEGAGKRQLALEAAKALNCREVPGVGCGRCVSCKKTAANRHPDVRVLDMAFQASERGEELEKQQSLKISTVLEERKRLYQSFIEGPWKVSIIDDAHKLTADAANVLLKVLEEPPARTAIFLLTPYRDRLFSTILSRCQPVRFRSGKAPGEGAANSPEIEALWAGIPRMTPLQILAKQPRGRSSVTRGDVEADLKKLMDPALRELRGQAGRSVSVAKVILLQKAQQQLRNNVPPSLVYEHLLLKLSKQR
jgi:DNA polymerase III gamma/tau subunit